MIVGSLIIRRFLSIRLLNLVTWSRYLLRKCVIQFFPTSSFSSHSLDFNKATTSFRCWILGGNLHSSNWYIHHITTFSSAVVRSCWYACASVCVVLPASHLRNIVRVISYASAVCLRLGKSPAFAAFITFWRRAPFSCCFCNVRCLIFSMLLASTRAHKLPPPNKITLVQ